MTKNLDEYISMPSPIQQELRSLFGLKDLLTIFDIGSCEGEESIKYSKLFPNSKIYAVEALPSNLQLIQINLKNYGVTNVELLPFALSDEKGISKFYVSSGQPEYKQEFQDWDYGNKSSSLLPPDKHLEIFPWLQFQNAIDVETDTLKNVCNQRGITTIDFIHMDVQGAELKVLQGSRDFIKKVKLIWLEVEAVTLYKNQPVKRDIEEFMQKNSFYKIKDTVGDLHGDQMYINLDYVFKSPTFFKYLLYFYLNSTAKSSVRFIKKLLWSKLISR